MSNLGNKEVLSKNLTYYVNACGKSQKEIAEIIGVPYTTFNDWIRGARYPRIDKIEIMARFFGILKSDLIEDKTEERERMKKENDILSDIIVRLRTDEEYLSLCLLLKDLDSERIASVKQMLSAFVK